MKEVDRVISIYDFVNICVMEFQKQAEKNPQRRKYIDITMGHLQLPSQAAYENVCTKVLVYQAASKIKYFVTFIFTAS